MATLEQDGESASVAARGAQAALLVWMTLMLVASSFWS
jgi:hypothetical protein